MADELKSIVIDKNTAASHALVAAVAGKRTTVYGIFIQAAGTVTVTFEDDDGTNLVGPLDFAAREALEWYPIPDGGGYVSYAETAMNKGFNMLLSGAVQVGGRLWYADASSL